MRRVRCTVATPGQQHLHAYCTYMVVLQIHHESAHDLFSTKSHIFFKSPFSYICIYTTKEKKRTHSPLTTRKIYKEETPCCWEMRIEKGERTREKVQDSPPECLLNKYAESKSLHLFDVMSLFVSPPLQSTSCVSSMTFSS